MERSGGEGGGDRPRLSEAQHDVLTEAVEDGTWERTHPFVKWRPALTLEASHPTILAV